jgi:hypothetical protein
MPLASSPSPPAALRRDLDTALPMHPRANAMRCVVALGRTERVHLRLELLDASGRILDALSARMGVRLWRQVLMPSVRTHAARTGLLCTIVEVMSLGAPPTPRPHRAPSSPSRRTGPVAASSTPTAIVPDVQTSINGL